MSFFVFSRRRFGSGGAVDFQTDQNAPEPTAERRTVAGSGATTAGRGGGGPLRRGRLQKRPEYRLPERVRDRRRLPDRRPGQRVPNAADRRRRISTVPRSGIRGGGGRDGGLSVPGGGGGRRRALVAGSAAVRAARLRFLAVGRQSGIRSTAAADATRVPGAALFAGKLRRAARLGGVRFRRARGAARRPREAAGRIAVPGRRLLPAADRGRGRRQRGTAERTRRPGRPPRLALRR